MASRGRREAERNTNPTAIGTQRAEFTGKQSHESPRERVTKQEPAPHASQARRRTIFASGSRYPISLASSHQGWTSVEPRTRSDRAMSRFIENGVIEKLRDMWGAWMVVNRYNASRYGLEEVPLVGHHTNRPFSGCLSKYRRSAFSSRWHIFCSVEQVQIDHVEICFQRGSQETHLSSKGSIRPEAEDVLFRASEEMVVADRATSG